MTDEITPIAMLADYLPCTSLVQVLVRERVHLPFPLWNAGMVSWTMPDNTTNRNSEIAE
eukprot:m.11775 g.11775  ORF g.11775 m.11775 type:complete len:59 (+) comp5767_c0_seq2:73-249(+)